MSSNVAFEGEMVGEDETACKTISERYVSPMSEVLGTFG